MMAVLSGCMMNSGYQYTITSKPYKVSGITYYPMASVCDFSETGQASWYGPGFHGNKTASGQIYDENALTAAHKTLPFGTRVRVTNMANGSSVVVVINDRGPFKRGRVIDLSRAAAKKLGMHNAGVTNVRLDVIECNPKMAKRKNIRKVYNMNEEYYVATGSYIVQNNANQASMKLKDAGYNNVIRYQNGRFMVLTGPYYLYAGAKKHQNRLRYLYAGAFVTR